MWEGKIELYLSGMIEWTVLRTVPCWSAESTSAGLWAHLVCLSYSNTKIMRGWAAAVNRLLGLFYSVDPPLCCFCVLKMYQPPSFGIVLMLIKTPWKHRIIVHSGGSDSTRMLSKSLVGEVFLLSNVLWTLNKLTVCCSKVSRRSKTSFIDMYLSWTSW